MAEMQRNSLSKYVSDRLSTTRKHMDVEEGLTASNFEKGDNGDLASSCSSDHYSQEAEFLDLYDFKSACRENNSKPQISCDPSAVLLHKEVPNSSTVAAEGTDYDNSINLKSNECGIDDSEKEAEGTIQTSNPNDQFTKIVETRGNDDEAQNLGSSSNTAAAEGTDHNNGIMMPEVRPATSEEKDSKCQIQAKVVCKIFGKFVKPEETAHDDSINLKSNESGIDDSQKEAEGTIQKSNPNYTLTNKVETRRNDDEAQNLGLTETIDKDKEALQKHITYYRLAEISEKSGDLYKALKQYELAFGLKPDFTLAKDRHRLVQDQIEQKKEECLWDFAKKEGVELKCDYKTGIQRIQQSQSLGRILDRILNKAEEADNTIGHILYDLLLELKPSFFGDIVVQVHENQHNCSFDDVKPLSKQLEKILELYLQFCDENEKPPVACHSLVTYLPFNPSLNKEVAAKQANYHLNLAREYKPKLQPCKRSGGKPRIGYVSSDFRNHSMTHLIGGLFKLHSSRVEVYLYSLSGDDDRSEFRQRIEKGKNYIFRDLTQTDFDGRANYIMDDGIDILVNLNGYTCGADNELFSLEQETVQVMWLGYPGTSSATCMDYFITDPESTPPEYASDFTEKLAYMPPSHFAGDHKKLFAHLIEKTEIRLMLDNETYSVLVINGKDLQPFREACGRDGLTVKGDKKHGEYVEVPLLCIILGRNFGKVLEGILPSLIKCLIWNYWRKAQLRNNDRLSIFGCEVLNGQMLGKCGQKKWLTGELVPDCLIFTARCQYGLPDDKVVFANFCQNYKFDERTVKLWINILLKVPNSILWLMKCSDKVERNIRKYVKESGIEENRLVFSLPVDKEEYIRRCQLADVFLDTPLCNAHTTGMDAIFAGLPLVTLPGRNIAARIAASLIEELGCPELIAESEEDYVDLAVKLGNNPQYLKETKEKVYKRRFESSLFDPSTKAKRLEDLLIYMYIWRHEKPQHITAFVSNQMKAVPPRELPGQFAVTTEMSECLSERQRNEHRDNENLYPHGTTELPSIEEESEVEAGNLPFLDEM